VGQARDLVDGSDLREWLSEWPKPTMATARRTPTAPYAKNCQSGVPAALVTGAAGASFHHWSPTS